MGDDTAEINGSASSTPVGVLLRTWRATRRMSQLALALEAQISTRHLSYIETGKAQPSREILARLADSLSMPLRARNALLHSAGYAAAYGETALSAPELAQVRRAIALILAQQEPYPAYVVNRYWDILHTNTAATRFLAAICPQHHHTNMVSQFFDPQDLRSAIVNWEEVAGDFLRLLQHDLAASPSDARLRTLLTTAQQAPGAPACWQSDAMHNAPPPLLTVVYRYASQHVRFFSTITTFATARDVTIDELRIECTFPADHATAAFCQQLAQLNNTASTGIQSESL